MNQFLGKYEVKVDAKGRVKIPTALMEQFPKKSERFVINCGFEQCLALYTFKEWERISSMVSKLNDFRKKHREFKRAFFRGATPINIDGNSRLLIPRHLLDYANITKEMVISAEYDKIELWDKSQYDKILKSDSDSYADLADEVFGDLDKSQE